MTLMVVGIGHDGPAGLTSEALGHIQQADVLVGGKRHLAFFPGWSGDTKTISAAPERVVQDLKAVYPHKKTVVLASGDPLFYGIGRLLTQHIPADDLCFLPHVSSVQLAFSRLKTSWHDAHIVSLHGRPLQTLLPAIHQRATQIALFTDGTNHPATVAQWLLDHYVEDYTVSVCEELGGHLERVTQWTLQSILGQTFSPLNITILQRQDTPPTINHMPLIGLPETDIAHRNGMITKREMRLLTLGYLALRAGEVFWDIGAGSGSVAIEAARLSPTLRVFAIERSEAAIAHIVQNIRTFTVPNVQPLLGTAPDCLADLPDPDAVFIGGSGGQLDTLLPTVINRLKPGGRIVMNCITLEHFNLGWDRLNQHELEVNVTSVQLSHNQPIGTLTRLVSDSPLFVLQAHKT